MKKVIKILAVIMMFSLCACGKRNIGTEGDKKEEVTTTIEEGKNTGSISKYEQYITIGKYKGLEITDISTEVPDFELEGKLATMFKDVVDFGDTVNISFDGYIDGKTFEGGSTGENGYDLEIGSGMFIDGFEDGLIGARVGETVTLELKFPKDYGEELLAGRAVTFVCVVNSIYGVAAPALTLEFVTENTPYTTIDEYKEAVRRDMIEEKAAYVETAQYQEVLEKLAQNCEVTEYPEELFDRYYERAADYFDSYIMQNCYYYFLSTGETVTYDGMLEIIGYTKEDIETFCDNAAKVNAKTAMALSVIAAREDITLTEEELNSILEQRMKEEKFSTVEEFYDFNGYTDELFREEIIFDKVTHFIMDNAVKVEMTGEYGES